MSADEVVMRCEIRSDGVQSKDQSGRGHATCSFGPQFNTCPAAGLECPVSRRGEGAA